MENTDMYMDNFWIPIVIKANQKSKWHLFHWIYSMGGGENHIFSQGY